MASQEISAGQFTKEWKYNQSILFDPCERCAGAVASFPSTATLVSGADSLRIVPDSMVAGTGAANESSSS
jgi:hypothetical protein